jgi:hypothetical protein
VLNNLEWATAIDADRDSPGPASAAGSARSCTCTRRVWLLPAAPLQLGIGYSTARE